MNRFDANAGFAALVGEPLALGGKDVQALLGDARVLRPVATCVATVDPTTSLLTSTYKFGDLYGRMKEQHNATLIGYRAKGARHPSINPPGTTRIAGGELFYIASTRLKEIAHGVV